MNKSVYLGLSISELSKIGINEFWNDYMKGNMEKNQNYISRMLAALQSTYKHNTFMLTLKKML